jgi:hypothetical protein
LPSGCGDALMARYIENTGYTDTFLWRISQPGQIYHWIDKGVLLDWQIMLRLAIYLLEETGRELMESENIKNG